MLFHEAGEGFFMVIKQVLNNNVVSALDEAGEEIILMGKGIGWQARKGEPVDEAKVQKRFSMDTGEGTHRLKQLLQDVRPEVLEVSSCIIDCAKKALSCQLNKNIYITLTDHISFALERLEKGCCFEGPMTYDVRKFYPREYALGQRALELILVKLHAKLPCEEAAAIALHIINSEFERDMSRTMDMTNITRQALDLVAYSFGINYDEDDLNYQRFVTHLQFFAQRVLEDKMLDACQELVFTGMELAYPKEFRVAGNICKLVGKEHGREIPHEEVVFLGVHIVRLTNKLKQK